MCSFSHQRLFAALLGAALMIVPVGKADAEVIFGSSLAFGERVSLTYDPDPLGLIPPPIRPPVVSFTSQFPIVAGAAPAPYSAGVGGAALLLPFLTASSLTVNVSSDVDGLPGARFAHADASINSLSLFPGVPLFTLALTSINSTADVTGDYGALTAVGTTTLAGAVLTFPLLPSIALIATPSANTIVPVPLPGVTVVLNEQIVSGDGISSRGIDVNAIHIYFNNVPVPGIPIGTLNGDIILAHSDARLVAIVPEPATGALAAAGGAALLLFRGMRRRSAVAGT